MADAFATILGIEGVVRADSFFALGGDSLRALRLAHALAREFGRPLAARDVFDRPTVTLLAAYLEEDQALVARDVPQV